MTFLFNRLINSQLLGLEGFKRAQNNKKKILLSINDVNSQNFFTILVGGSPNFDYRPKMELRKRAAEYSNAYKIQTSQDNAFKFSDCK